ALGVLLERGQLIAPEGLDLLDPAAQRRKRLAPQAIDPHAGVVIGVGVLLLDQAGLAQDAQVPAHGRGADVERARQLAGAARSLAQQVDGATAGRVGERGEGAVERVGLHAATWPWDYAGADKTTSGGRRRPCTRSRDRSTTPLRSRWS